MKVLFWTHIWHNLHFNAHLCTNDLSNKRTHFNFEAGLVSILSEGYVVRTVSVVAPSWLDCVHMVQWSDGSFPPLLSLQRVAHLIFSLPLLEEECFSSILTGVCVWSNFSFLQPALVRCRCASIFPKQQSETVFGAPSFEIGFLHRRWAVFFSPKKKRGL